MAKSIKNFPARPDAVVKNHGSIAMVCVLTKEAHEWVAQNVPLESWQWCGNAFACEPRMVENLVHGMTAEGLLVV